MKKVKIIICVVSMLSMSYAAYAQKKPDNLEYSLHLFYKNEMFHKKFFEGFGEDFLSAFFSGLAMGLGSYGMGGDFNTGYAVGAMSELNKQAYRDAVLPSNEGHVHAFGRCLVDEAFIYVVDVNSCDKAFIKVQYAETSGKDMHTKKMTSSGLGTVTVFRKSVEYDKCRDWALELHKRKLKKCEEFTNREQMPYLAAVSNRVKDEQKNPRKYWDKSDAYETLQSDHEEDDY